MASRSHTWFDRGKLLPDETLLREGPARLRTYAAPYWWEGHLMLTSDRLFFLPAVEHPLEGPVAFWLAEVSDEETGAGGLLRISTHEGRTVFQIPGLGFVAQRGARNWARSIGSAKMRARHPGAFEGIDRRAAG